MGEKMAEVRKKKIEDTYNTSKIKVKEKSSKTKKTEKNSSKKNTKKESSNKENYNIFDRIRIFFSGVKSEFLKVHWTSKKDMLKYSIAVIFFIVFCSLFFYLLYILFALLQSALA